MAALDVAADGGGPRSRDRQPSPDGSAMSRDETHISRGAVSLAWLKQISQDLGNLSTKQLVDDKIIPATIIDKCRYTDILLKDKTTKNMVSQGRKFYFISHAWSRPFKETLSMVLKHFEPEEQRLWHKKDGQPLPTLHLEDVFVWFDMFAVNQHNKMQIDLAGLWEVVHDAEQTLMVLDPEGTVATRIWCLYEALHAWKAGQKAGRNKFRLLSYGLRFQHLKQVFIDLDVCRAKAFKEDDLKQILDDIKRDVGGLHTMTHILKQALVDGVLAQVHPQEETSCASADGYATTNLPVQLCINRLADAALMCELYGFYSEAEPLYRRALEGCEQVLGANHPDTLTSVNNLAGLLRAQGNYTEAEPLYRRALEGREQVLGANHPDTLTSVNNLAGLLQAQGKNAEKVTADQ